MIDIIGAFRKLLTDVGNNDDAHDGATLFGRLMQALEHIHSAQEVYPSLADGVSLTTGAGDWGLGTITEIVPINTITSEFDIHEVLVEDVNTQDKTYELVLYYGAGDTERFDLLARCAGCCRQDARRNRSEIDRGRARDHRPASAALRAGEGQDLIRCACSGRVRSGDAGSRSEARPEVVHARRR